MKSLLFSVIQRTLPCLVLLLPAASLPCLEAQTNPIVTVAQIPSITVAKDAVVNIPLEIQVRNGFHINSDHPADEFLIPLKLTWDPETLASVKVSFPKPESVKYSFSDQPLSVYTGSVKLETHAKLAATAKPGISMLTGKLHYQGCNETMCFPPKTLAISVPLTVK